MRYYLAIDSYLDAPDDQQLEERLAKWFDSTEQYSHQLHEMNRSDYLAMKRKEYERMKQRGESRLMAVAAPKIGVRLPNTFGLRVA